MTTFEELEIYCKENNTNIIKPEIHKYEQLGNRNLKYIELYCVFYDYTENEPFLQFQIHRYTDINKKLLYFEQCLLLVNTLMKDFNCTKFDHYLNIGEYNIDGFNNFSVLTNNTVIFNSCDVNDIFNFPLIQKYRKIPIILQEIDISYYDSLINYLSTNNMFMLSHVVIPKNIHNLDIPDYCELRYSDIGNVFYLHHLKCSIIKFELYKYSNIEKEIKKLKILIELENILIEVFGFNGHIYNKHIIKISMKKFQSQLIHFK